MPTIRFLTPADYPDMCDILDKHTSGPGAYANDRTAAPSADFNWHAKWYIDTLFEAAMTNFFGYFDDEGRLAAFVCFIRWVNDTDISINIKVEDPTIDLPRAEGARWSDVTIDLINWGVGYFYSEGVTTFWTLMMSGQEAASFAAHENCILNQYGKEKVLSLPAGELPPEQYRRVQWMPIFQDSEIYKYTDPLPLSEYLKVENDPTGLAG
ncbi:hypothetical protein FXV83_16520 [Bradyrhizobium hipponense]|uniref:Uncharacterized protein n=1 Tax=Bradyrhizobium hipponense TaxID=2605638 RepID=A0A5S4YQ84_9BRAD|nr:hypothetical protein [Bradyrhizobium hipponense]TYO65535.1 hypothetical protein FXV83_16520 [Bradyrhizobium hipponense]